MSLASFFEQLGVAQDVRAVALPQTAALLYVQNISDWHVVTHLKPLMGHGRWLTGVQGRSSVCPERRMVVTTGDWGQGRIAPPTDQIGLILAQLAKLPMDAAVFDGLAQAAAVLPAAADLPIRAKANLKEGRVVISIDRDGHPEDANYAFYLLEDGQRTDVVWYTQSPGATFVTEVKDPGRLGVRVFARRGVAEPIWRIIKVDAG